MMSVNVASGNPALSCDVSPKSGRRSADELEGCRSDPIIYATAPACILTAAGGLERTSKCSPASVAAHHRAKGLAPMIVCSCNVLSDRAIRACLRSG